LTYGFKEGRLSNPLELIKLYEKNQDKMYFYNDDNERYTTSKVEKYFEKLVEAGRGQESISRAIL